MKKIALASLVLLSSCVGEVQADNNRCSVLGTFPTTNLYRTYVCETRSGDICYATTQALFCLPKR